MDFMYKKPGDLLDRESYLTGKRIDKNFEEFSKEKPEEGENCVEHEVLPASIGRRIAEKGESNDQVDLLRKQMEDPLLVIAKKSFEARQRKFQNPESLKKMYRILKQEEIAKRRKNEDGVEIKPSRQRDEVHKTDKLRKGDKSNSRRSRSSSESSDQDSDEKLKALLKSLPKSMNLEKLKSSLSSQLKDDDESDSDRKRKRREEVSRDSRDTRSERDESVKKKLRRVSRSRSRSNYRKIERSRRRSNSPRNKKDVYEHADRKQRRKSRSRSKDRNKDKKSLASPRRGHSHKTKSYEKGQRYDSPKKRIRTPERKIEYPKRSSPQQSSNSRRQRSTTPPKRQDKRRSPTPEKSSPSPQRKRNYDSDDDLRPAKKNYGLVSASGEKLYVKKSYEEQRRVESKPRKPDPPKRYVSEKKKPLTEEEIERAREEMAKNAAWREKDRAVRVRKQRESAEKEDTDHSKKFDKDFMTKQMRTAQEKTGSLETRIKSNINNIQRSGMSMNTNFAKR